MLKGERLEEHMTDLALDIECAHIIENRLGVLCGTDEPTMAQCMIAQTEANEWRAARIKERATT